MKTLYLDRSTSTGRSGAWVEELDLTGVERIVVGLGPGSFAGIRSSLAFAQGYALGSSCCEVGATDCEVGATDCEVLGLPSPCGVALEEGAFAVVGDARREKYWVALFAEKKLISRVFQVSKDDLYLRVPLSAKVVSPDQARIGEFLAETFGDRYLGERLPTDEGLKAYAEAHPEALIREPLPIYLNPAVRD